MRRPEDLFCEARNVHRFVDASENQVVLVYTGDTSTILLHRVAIANIKMNNCGNLFCGSFGLPHDLHNVIDSIAIFNATYDSTNEEGMVVFGANIYRFNFTTSAFMKFLFIIITI